MEKPRPWEQNRCVFSSRDTSKLMGRQEYHVPTDKGLSGSWAHKGAPVLLNPLPVTPPSRECNAFRFSSILPHPPSFPSSPSLSTHTHIHTCTRAHAREERVGSSPEPHCACLERKRLHWDEGGFCAQGF